MNTKTHSSRWRIVRWTLGVVVLLGAILGIYQFKTWRERERVREAAARTVASSRRSAAATSAAHGLSTQFQRVRELNESFAFMRSAQGFAGVSPAHDLSAQFESTGVAVRSRSGHGAPVLMQVSGYGRGAKSARFEATSFAEGECPDPTRVDTKGACLARLERQSGELTEWWINDTSGLEQGFTVASAPAGRGELRVDITLGGAQVELASDRRSATFSRTKDAALRYASLRALDADGQTLEAWMEKTRHGLALVVDDRDAEYPVVIDPVVTPSAASIAGSFAAALGDVNGDGRGDLLVANGTASVFLGTSSGPSSTAAWTSSQSSVTAVAGVGDINKDGYADFMVGNASSANLYLGSASTLSTTAAWTVSLSVTAIAAGDVTGDGYPEVAIGDKSGTGRVTYYQNKSGSLASTPFQTFTGSSLNQYWSDTRDSLFGTALAMGDVGANGYAGLAIGAYGFSALYDTGGVVFFLTSTGAQLNPTPVTIYGNMKYGQFGRALAIVGNATSNGTGILVVGEPWYDTNTNPHAYAYGWSFNTLSSSPFWQKFDTNWDTNFGLTIAAVGDVDGDAYGDWIIGADDSWSQQEGRAVIFHGGPTTPFAETNINGTSGQRIGYFVGGAGDVDGDGYSDVLVRGSTPLFLYRGAAATSTLTSTYSNPGKGNAVARAGDVNGDGFDDAVAGFDDGAYVHWGGTSGVSSDTTITAPVSGAGFGNSVAGAGDVNKDGYADVIIGAPLSSSGAGAFYVYFGNSGGVSSSPDVTVTGTGTQALGSSVDTAGDSNGDGYADVIVGAPGSGSDVGAAFLYSGTSTGIVTATPTKLSGSQASARFGASVAGLGDVNADGFADLVVGEPDWDNGQTDEGRVQVFHGSATGLVTTAAFSYESDAGGAEFGSAVASAGDVDGNGRADLIVGASKYANGETDEGQVRVLFASSKGGIGTSVTPFSVECNAANCLMGQDVGAADVNGDGYSDILIGATGDAHDNNRGGIYYLGGSTGVSATQRYLPGTAATLAVASRKAFIISSAGDLNRDGFEDVIARDPSSTSQEGYSLYLGGETIANNANLGGVRFGTAATPFAVGAAITPPAGLGVAWSNPRNPFSRTRARLSHSLLPLDGTASAYPDPIFGSTGLQSTADPSNRITDQISFVYDSRSYAVRSRLFFATADAVLAPFSRWRYFGPLGWPSMRVGSCPTGFTSDGNGSACNVCATNYYGSSCTYCVASETCSSQGICSSSGTCTCNDGFVGAGCQYSDATTCKGHGAAQADGSCICQSGFTTANCSTPTCNSHGTGHSDGTCTCASGFAGPYCEYSDSVTCSGHGSAQNDGSCSCTAAFTGTRCDSCATDYYAYPTCTHCVAASTCNGHGACNASGQCDCAASYTDAACASCATNRYAYPTCTFCDAATTCSGFGSCTSVGDCSCSSGHAGGNCQYSDAVTCTGHGSAHADGSCTCSGLFAGARCDGCVTGYAGSTCQYSNAVTCNAHGTAQTDGSCQCDSGFAGSSCQYSASATCNSHGVADNNGNCTCDAAYSGTSCTQCATGYFVYPTCRQCNAATTCNGRGTCDASGFCVCSAGAAGSHCEYTDATTCNGHGTAKSDGSCTCSAAYQGTGCSTCSADHYGYPSCVACVASSTCSSHGSCNASGACACAAGFGGASCSQCAAGFVDYPRCTACADATTCRGHGTCTASGSCSCTSGFSGDYCQYSNNTSCLGHGTANSSGQCSCETAYTGSACETCASGYFDYPSCRNCSDSQCGGGSCDANGKCSCPANTAGSSCQYSRATTCSGHGTPSASGSCTCDTGYVGTACQYSRLTTCYNVGTPQSSGTCICDTGHAGPHCEYSDSFDCHSHGQAHADGSCKCEPNFAGAGCEHCAAGATGTYCLVCDATKCPTAWGSCGTDGECVCKAGRAGAHCQFDSTQTCGEHGTVREDGSCECAAGYDGIVCQFSNDVTCSGGGAVQFNGTCKCRDGYAGVHCQFSDAATCNDHGKTDENGACTCRSPWNNAHCDHCLPGRVVYPECRECSRANDCGGHGDCQYADGKCACDAGFAGPGCKYSDKETCHGLGRVHDDGSCSCDPHFAGKDCTSCAEDWFGDGCKKYCNAQATCGGLGTCTDKGECTCAKGSIPDDNGGCKSCPPGNGCPDGMHTKPCEPGTFAAGGAIKCETCPRDYATGFQYRSTECEYCAPYCPPDKRPGTITTCGPVEKNHCTTKLDPDAKTCGNGKCDHWPDLGLTETCDTCAKDCGVCPVCGDGICASDSMDNAETCWNCPVDCKVCAPPKYPVRDHTGYTTDWTPNGSHYQCAGQPAAATKGPKAPPGFPEGTESKKLYGHRLSIETSYSGDYTSSYDADTQMCAWKSSRSASAKACVEAGETVEGCFTVSTSQSVDCSIEVQCNEFGYSCTIQDPLQAACTMESSQSWDFNVAWKFFEAGFDPIYVDGTLNVGGSYSYSGTTTWGAGTACANSTTGIAYATTSSLLARGSGTLRAGVTLGGQDFDLVNVTAGICVIQTTGPDPNNECARRTTKSGVTMGVKTSGFVLALFSLDGRTWVYTNGEACEYELE